LRARLERRHGDRGAWALLLFGADDGPRASPAGVAAASAIGGVLMAKYVFAVACAALLLLGGWYVLDDATSSDPTTIVADSADARASTTDSAPNPPTAATSTEAVDAPATDPADAKTPPIRGFVHALGGGPVAGALVELARVPSGGDRIVLATTRTDPAGKFSLKAAAWRPDATVAATAPGFALGSGVAAPGGFVDLALPVGGILRGRVFDETTGAPIAGARVVGGSFEAPVERVEERTTTASDGTYELAHLLPWTTYVTVAVAEHAAESARINVKAGATTLFDVPVRRGGAVAGRVTRAGKPVAGARVSLSDCWRDLTSVVSDADGGYALHGFSGDNAWGGEAVVVTADGPLHAYVLLPRQRADELHVDVDLTNCWTIRGVVRSGGAPAARARVERSAWLGSFGGYRRFVDARDDGTFVIAANERDPCELDAESFDGVQVVAVKVPRPRDGDVADGVVIDLPVLVDARARIVSEETGAPIAGADTSFQGQPRTRTRSDDAGVVRMRLPPGAPIKVWFLASGFTSIEHEVRADAGATNDVGDIVLSRAKSKSGSIAGHVRALDGTPMASVPVVAIWSHDDVGRALSAADGSFRIDGLPTSGAGSVQARFPGMTSYQHEGVESGDADVNLELAPVVPRFTVAVTRSDGKPAHGFTMIGYARRAVDGGSDALDWVQASFVRQPDGRFAAAEGRWLDAEIAEIEVVDGDEIARVPVTLVDGETVDVPVALAPGCTIHGRVLVPGGGPAVRTLVRVYRGGESGGEPPQHRVARTGQDGRFQVGPVLPGRYRVSIEDERMFPRRVVSLDVRVGEYVEVNETLSAGSIRVRVVDADERPVSNAIVCLYDADGAPAFNHQLGSTSSDGMLTARRIDPGKCRIRAFDNSRRPAAQADADVEVRADETTEVVVRLPR
jgi:hypothetical protein